MKKDLPINMKYVMFILQQEDWLDINSEFRSAFLGKRRRFFTTKCNG